MSRRAHGPAHGEIVLVLAPHPDGEHTRDELEDANVRVMLCPTADALYAALDDAAAVVVAEEALDASVLTALAMSLSRQPVWSELPLVVLTTGSDAREKTWDVLRALEPVSHVTLLERPFRRVTLINAVRLAMRARSRQHAIRRLQEGLEERVRERTAALALLGDVAAMANEATNFAEAVRFCLERVSRSNGWCFGHAYVRLPEDPDRLSLLDAHYAEAPERFEAFRARVQEMRLGRGEGLPGRVLRTGRAESTDDIAAALGARDAHAGGGLGIRTAIAFPVQSGGDVRSVLEFFADAPVEISDELTEALGAIGAHLARVLERETAKRALEESEAILRQVNVQIRDVVWLQEIAADRVVYCSPNYEAIWGRPPERLYADPRDWLAAAVEEDREAVTRAYERALEGEPLDETFRVARPDGALCWVRTRAYPVLDEKGRPHRLAAIAEDATRRKELEQRAARIVEAEQKRIGRDLHDTVGQELVGLALSADRAARRLEEQQPIEAETLRTLAQGARQALAGVRAAARGLSAIAEDGEGLALALQELADSVRRRYGIACVFESPELVDVPPGEAPSHLYRIASEAVANAARHGKPRRIAIELRADDGQRVLEITDDGTGMPKAVAGNGMGLWTMEQRAAAIGAQLQIEPRPGGGTLVRCVLGPS